MKKVIASTTTICALTSMNVAAQEVVKIGVVAPLTGNSAEYGKNIENGVQIALQEANVQQIKIGGKAVRFEIDAMDDQGDPRIGVQVAQRLVDEKADAVVGHFNSGTTIPASKVYSSAGIPLINPAATNPQINQEGSKTVFSIIPSDSQNAGRAAEYVVQTMKAKRIAIIDDRTAFGQGAAEQFQKRVQELGGNIVDRQYVSDTSVEFSAQLTHIKQSNADVLFFAGLNPQVALVAKRIKQLGMKTALVGGGGVVTDTFIKIAGSSAEGAQAVEYGTPISSSARGAAFINKYKAKYGDGMLPYAAFGYDAAWLAIKSMQKADSSKPTAYLPALRATEMEGVSGHIEFSDNGSLKNPRSTVYRVQNGAWVPVSSGS